MWQLKYDEDLDSLYYSPDTIPSNFTLFSLNDEFSVFVDENSNVGGVFIEYYKNNLTTHEEKFKPFKRIFLEKANHFTTIPKKLEEKAILLKEVLKAEILSEIVKVNQDRLTIVA